eukprot:TRINITY_DN9812_c0_g1_i1.p1 TRINITY_DN9812_c0_g1~~TRINITY_DN9812_c0_g1_i1.p1  ORF type:complete len:1019 (-),score=153.07 TRINITY_DN9812_c0_g1_i1:98-3154(-)
MWACSPWLLLVGAANVVVTCDSVIVLKTTNDVRKQLKERDAQEVLKSGVFEARLEEAEERNRDFSSIPSRWCGLLERSAVNGGSGKVWSDSQRDHCEVALVASPVCFMLVGIVILVCCCDCKRNTIPQLRSSTSAANIRFALTFYFLPDPLYYLNVSSMYWRSGQTLLRLGICLIVAKVCINVFDRMLPAFLSIEDLLGASGFVLVLVGCYLCLLKLGIDHGVALIARELTCTKASDVADAYPGGRNQFLEDLEEVLDSYCMTVVRRLLKGKEELRADIAVRCLNTSFFDFVVGDTSSLHTLLVALVLTASSPRAMNVDSSLRKAVRRSLQCKPDPLSEIFLQYAYPHRKNIQSFLGPHEDDYGKVMLGLSAYLLPSVGDIRSRLLQATMSMAGTDDRNLMRFLLCCSFEERKAMVRAYNSRHRTADHALSDIGTLVAAVTDEKGGNGGIFGHMFDSWETSSSALYRQALTTVIQNAHDVKKMYIKVVAAHNLPHMETCLQGKNDCYVEVRVGNQTVKTQVLTNSGSDPRWDEHLEPILLRSDSPPCVDVRVMESDGILGSTPFGQFLTDDPWSMEGIQTFSLDSEVKQSTNSKLLIKVISAAGLPASGRGAGASYPCVRVTHGLVSRSSRSVADGANPLWNEFLDSMPVLEEEPVNVEVLKSDIEGAEVLGQYSVDLKHLNALQRKKEASFACCAADWRSLFQSRGSELTWVDIDVPLLGKTGEELPGQPKLHLALQIRASKHRCAARSLGSPMNPMTLTLETHFYEPGKAPWENMIEHLETKLREEMRGLQRKSTLLRLLCTAGSDTLQALMGGELLCSVLGVVRGDASSSLLSEFLDMLMRDNRTTPEQPFSERYLVELEACMKETTMGTASTDELGLIGLLVPVNAKDRSMLQTQYQARFGRNLLNDLHLATVDSVILEELVLGLAHDDQNWPWARTLYEAMRGGWTGIGTDESTLTDIIVLNLDNLQGVQEQYREVTTRRGAPENLLEAVTAETSGRYRTFLLSLLATSERSA